MDKKSKKKDDFSFHFDNIKALDKEAQSLRELEGFNMRDAYTREDEKGWWMVTKQILIRKYISLYLNVFNGLRQHDVRLFFIDMLSNNGMNLVTKNEGNDRFIFSGTPISAPLLADRYEKGFFKYYCNDYDPDNRKILISRYDVLNEKRLNNRINYYIDNSEERIDSNEWIYEVIDDINKSGRGRKHTLVIIDNQGASIKYDVLKLIKKRLQYVDFIITFQPQDLGRKMDTKKVKEFFGCEIPKESKRSDLLPLYKAQLEKIGISATEILVNAKSSNYFYYLLFCIRNDSSGKWMKMIEKYRDERFANWHDKNVKEFWDIVKRKQSSLSAFFR